MEQKPQVLIVMGSDSDYNVLQDAFSILTDFGVSWRAAVCSAHRTPDEAARLSKNAAGEGVRVILAAAGLAAHLPGVLAAYTTLPVIGIPISAGALKGVDALYAIVQMPKGIPVATVAIDGAANAALLAVQMLALQNPALQEKLVQYKSDMAKAVGEKNSALQAKISGLK